MEADHYTGPGLEESDQEEFNWLSWGARQLKTTKVKIKTKTYRYRYDNDNDSDGDFTCGKVCIVIIIAVVFIIVAVPILYCVCCRVLGDEKGEKEKAAEKRRREAMGIKEPKTKRGPPAPLIATPVSFSSNVPLKVISKVGKDRRDSFSRTYTLHDKGKLTAD